MKRLLWFLGFCDLVWLYYDDNDAQTYLRILRCDSDKKKYVFAKPYSDTYYYVVATRLFDSGHVESDLKLRWKLYEPHNKPQSKGAFATKWCRIPRDKKIDG